MHDEDTIRPDEILYRRIPLIWKGPPPSRDAFEPKQQDGNGLSLYRKKHVSLLDAARSPTNPGRHYFVAELIAGDLLQQGMKLQIDPKDKGHVLIPNLNFQNREGDAQQRWQTKMAMELCRLIDPRDFQKNNKTG